MIGSYCITPCIVCIPEWWWRCCPTGTIVVQYNINVSPTLFFWANVCHWCCGWQLSTYVSLNRDYNTIPTKEHILPLTVWGNIRTGFRSRKHILPSSIILNPFMINTHVGIPIKYTVCGLLYLSFCEPFIRFMTF